MKEEATTAERLEAAKIVKSLLGRTQKDVADLFEIQESYISTLLNNRRRKDRSEAFHCPNWAVRRIIQWWAAGKIKKDANQH